MQCNKKQVTINNKKRTYENKKIRNKRVKKFKRQIIQSYERPYFKRKRKRIIQTAALTVCNAIDLKKGKTNLIS